MTRYLSLDDLLAIHDEMLARFGGLKGVRDANALDSAIGRPQSGYYADVIEQPLLSSKAFPRIIPSWRWKQAFRHYGDSSLSKTERLRADLRRCRSI